MDINIVILYIMCFGLAIFFVVAMEWQKKFSIKGENTLRDATLKVTNALAKRIKKLENPPKFKVGDTVFVRVPGGEKIVSIVTNVWYCEWTNKNMYCFRNVEHCMLDIEECLVEPYTEGAKQDKCTIKS